MIPRPIPRRHACDRCRRQKLRCDRDKPCALCIRSGFQCVVTGSTGRTAGSRSLRQSKRFGGDRSGQKDVAPVGTTLASSSSPPSTGRRAPVEQFDDGPASPSPRVHPLHSQLSGTSILPERLGATSSLELTHELLSRNNDASQQRSRSGATFAIPGGALSPDTAQLNGPLSLAQQLHELHLPSREVCDFLLDKFLDSVHWFMMVFHEPSLRALYDEVMTTGGAVGPEQSRVVALILTILIMGARYAAIVNPQREGEEEIIGLSHADLEKLQSNMLTLVKDRFFDVMNYVGIESVQVCVLLGSFYLYTGKPNLALGILGAGVRGAQALNLHQEQLWGKVDTGTRENRKRAWWAVYVFDRFASLIYGRPPSVRDSDCDVQMLGETEYTNVRHARFRSGSEPAPEQTAVTILTYQNCKNSLYTISASILNEVYGTPGITLPSAIQSAIKINNRLVSWCNHLPPELRLENYRNLTLRGCSDAEQRINKIFALQALTLQLAYDNMQIVLHRPFLRYNIRSFNKADFVDGGVGLASSAEQCFHSALRTCQIGFERQEVLVAARGTHAGAYLAIQNFTAGVTLSTIALSRSMSLHIQEAKQGVAYAISLQRMLSKKFTVSAQTLQVLEKLLHLIFSHEMELMLASACAGHPDAEIEHIQSSTNGSPEPPVRCAVPAAQVHQPDNVSPRQSNGGQGPSLDHLNSEKPQEEARSPGENPMLTLMETNLDVGTSDATQWESLSHDVQLDNAIFSVQDGNSSTLSALPNHSSRGDTEDFVPHHEFAGNNLSSSHLFGDMVNFGNGNPLADGQYWLWNINPLGE